MVRGCLRNKTPFGVVAAEFDEAQALLSKLPFALTGTSCLIIETDVPNPGLITIRCQGQKKFRVHSAEQQKDGLWLGEVEDIADEVALAIPEDLQMTIIYLQQLIESVKQQGISEQQMPFSHPYKFNDCAWVANRWCEILRMPLIDKQRLLELDSPLIRLELIQDILNTDFSVE